jgi:PTH2 family peptidyl-tRNA hydrolase
MTVPSEPPSPSTASYVIATAILCAVGGYFIGQASSLGLFGSSGDSRKKSSWPNSYDVKIHPDSSDEELMTNLENEGIRDTEDDDDSDEEQGELKDFPENKEECKLVLVVRTDLGMGKGVSLLCPFDSSKNPAMFLDHPANHLDSQAK